MEGNEQPLYIGGYNGIKCSKGTIMHELGHVLGFWHEHNRPDRDKYVTIIKENIRPGANFDFKTASPYQVIYSKEYDYGSIMHYGETVSDMNKNQITLSCAFM